eukprot:1139070-Pelagomonas_calceolata.AAC.1
MYLPSKRNQARGLNGYDAGSTAPMQNLAYKELRRHNHLLDTPATQRHPSARATTGHHAAAVELRK